MSVCLRDVWHGGGELLAHAVTLVITFVPRLRLGARGNKRFSWWHPYAFLLLTIKPSSSVVVSYWAAMLFSLPTTR